VTALISKSCKGPAPAPRQPRLRSDDSRSGPNRLEFVACQQLAPDVEGFRALALLRLIKPPLTDKDRLCLTVVHPDGECLAKLYWFISRSPALQLQRRTRSPVEGLLLKWLLLPDLVPSPVSG
jgi:hypothetical protein